MRRRPGRLRLGANSLPRSPGGPKLPSSCQRPSLVRLRRGGRDSQLSWGPRLTASVLKK